MWNVELNKNLCKRCKICIQTCPRGVFDENEQEEVTAVRIVDCTGCQLCVRHCPEFALCVEECQYE